MAKRNCRRTMDEKAIHEKAVKLRKKTDEELVHYVENCVEKARSEGYHSGRTAQAGQAEKGANEFLALLQLRKVPGIGAATVDKLVKVAEENGYL